MAAGVVIAMEVRKLYEEEARERQATSGPGVYGGKPLTTQMQKAVETAARAAEQLGVSKSYVYTAERLKKNGEAGQS